MPIFEVCGIHFAGYPWVLMLNPQYFGIFMFTLPTNEWTSGSQRLGKAEKWSQVAHASGEVCQEVDWPPWCRTAACQKSLLFQAFLIGSQGNKGGGECIRISNFAVSSIFLFIQGNQNSGCWKWEGSSSQQEDSAVWGGKRGGHGDTLMGQTFHRGKGENKGEREEERC